MSYSPSITTHNPPFLKALIERRCAEVCGARSASLLALWPPSPFRTWQKKTQESCFEKRTKLEKLLISIPLNPWPPVEPGTGGSNAHTPIRHIVFPNTKQCRSMPQAQLTDERGRTRKHKSVWQGGLGDLVGGRAPIPVLVVWVDACHNALWESNITSTKNLYSVKDFAGNPQSLTEARRMHSSPVQLHAAEWLQLLCKSCFFYCALKNEKYN